MEVVDGLAALHTVVDDHTVALGVRGEGWDGLPEHLVEPLLPGHLPRSQQQVPQQLPGDRDS